MKVIFAALVGLALVAATPAARAQDVTDHLDRAGDALSRGVDQAGDMVGRGVDGLQRGFEDVTRQFQSGDIDTTQKRDTLTLAIGGVAGFLAGSLVSGIGLLSIEVIGLPLIPLVATAAGVWLANEGYFDDLRG